MGQVLGFAHCKEAPSTASSTPDSTEGPPEEPPFPAPPEDEDDDDDDDDEGRDPLPAPRDPPPRELTFSYIAFGGGGRPPTPPRDPRRGRAPPRLSPPRRGGGGAPRGPGPPPATPPGRRGETPAPPERGGAAGEEEEEETPGRRAAPAPLPAPPPGGAHLPRPAPPPPPADQSASAPGADGQVSPLSPLWELLSWRVPARSALALLLALLALGSLSRFSAVAVVAHGALAVLAVTVPLRLRQLCRGLLSPASAGDSATRRADPLTPEQQQRWARCLARHAVAATRSLARLFLVQSVPESLKFAFLFYLLTYVGAACNGLTLLAAGVVGAFTFPVLQRRHQAQIQQCLSLARSHLSHLRARVLAALPSAKATPQ